MENVIYLFILLIEYNVHKKLINSINIKNLKIMTQKNEISARALSMEELENVNGGRVDRRRLTHRTIGY